ncbi:CPBP family intramembrane metalloprotease [Propioniciclava coleopterorum]|uniref:CPBP family intramembrane metalloprotease n=1 Tax=Propioniciclava coleopterorum TaxID=2714937 RepID=A0A6G7Y2N4_9ACTN|nr:CPBP family intramembrane glutamic endopeptidase [Propioniciclava coleopterorum]QIK71144.1 CPBP family intramembrane metalloprotease [Propioniciclava coleopterorum]
MTSHNDPREPRPAEPGPTAQPPQPNPDVPAPDHGYGAPQPGHEYGAPAPGHGYAVPPGQPYGGPQGPYGPGPRDPDGHGPQGQYGHGPYGPGVPQPGWMPVPTTADDLPPHLRPALPVETRDYFAFWRAPRYRWWKSLLALLMAGGIFLALSGVAGFIGMAIDGVDFAEVSRTGEIPVGPGFFIANNVSLALCIPIAMLTAWACVGQRPRWLTSVVGGMRWRWFWLVVGVLTPLWIVLMAIGYAIMPPQDVGLWPHTVPMIVGILLTTPFQAAGEEYLVRGLLGRVVASWFPAPAVGFGVSTLVTALVFMALHGAGDPWLNVYYVAFALVGSWLTWRTGGLEAAVAIHIVNNMLSEALLPFIDISGMFDREAGAGDATILINIGVLLIAGVLIDFLARRRKLVKANDPGRAELDATLASAAAYGPRF